jgi:sugar phosphate isomerase/epimerase
MPITTSFITANYVARAKGYDGTPDWGYHDRATVASANPSTFMLMAADIAAAGFDHIDLWTAHCHFRHHDREDYLEQVKGILSNYDFTITSYAGGLTPLDIDPAFRFMKQLGAPVFAGGLFGDADPDRDIPVIADTCMKYQARYAFENHPEKSADEILRKIQHGKYPNIGVALDTGWCATQGFDALDAVKRLRDHLFIVHLKDIKTPGGHETCTLGDGVVPIQQIVRYLKDSGWSGNLSIEHEPYDHDPMPEIQISLQRVKEWLK